MAKKKRKSLLTQQREKLKAQKAAKEAAKKAAKGPSRKALPPAGGSSASSNKARYQRVRRKGKMAEKQVSDFVKAYKKVSRQRAAQDKLESAKKGTKSTGTKYASGSARQKALPPAGQTSKKATPKGRASAKRAQAAAKQQRAARGTQGTRTRVGQPKGAANRYYGADRVNAAVKRAQRSTLKGRIATGARGYAAQAAGIHLASKMAETIGKKGQSKMSRLGIDGSALPKAEAKPKRQVTKRNRRGRSVDVKPTKKRGTSNIPKNEGTLGQAEYALGYGSFKKGAVTVKNSQRWRFDGKDSNGYPKWTRLGYVKAANSGSKPKKSAPKATAPKTKSKAPVKASKPRSAAPKAKSSGGKNPYRMPQGAERKDRMSKVVKELKAMKLSSKKRQEAQKPKKKMSRNEKNLRRRQGR